MGVSEIALRGALKEIAKCLGNLIGMFKNEWSRNVFI